ncbi:MAG TPA: tetratricopeptide repeat protein [Longimicrobiaceae bacterium]|nr:tetratricopeptide repeat protein [Longimicrobiaceae bacterium]
MMRRFVMLVGCGVLFAGCDDGNRLYREGEYRRAAGEYREALERGDRSPALRYNLGTALLRLEQWDEARGHLESAAAGEDRRVRQPAHYNGGNADLEPVFRRQVPDSLRRVRLERAIAAYKRALLLDPADMDAKWNLEIALRLLERERPPEAPSGGGGGGGGGYPAPSRPDVQPRPASAGVTPEEAERLLAGAERAERELQREKLRKDQPRNRAVRDW